MEYNLGLILFLKLQFTDNPYCNSNSRNLPNPFQ